MSWKHNNEQTQMSSGIVLKIVDVYCPLSTESEFPEQFKLIGTERILKSQTCIKFFLEFRSPNIAI